MSIERKSLDVEIKSADETGSIELYAAVFGNVDRDGDVIEPGAFANVAEFVRDGMGLFGHDARGLPVATVDSVTQDGTGLLVKAAFHSTPEAQAVRTVVTERLRRGKSVKASIGYRTLDAYFKQIGEKMVRCITKLEIFEFSIVNVPANPAAEVLAAKGAMPTVSDIMADVAEVKAGRKISSARMERLKSVRDRLAETMAAIDDVLAEQPEPEGPDGDEGKAAGARRKALLIARIKSARVRNDNTR